MVLLQEDGYASCHPSEDSMLTASQKANILKKTGVAVPRCPIRRTPAQDCKPFAGEGTPEVRHDSEQQAAVKEWSRAVEALYVGYVAARAAKSLRDSEEARQLDLLRRLASPSGA